MPSPFVKKLSAFGGAALFGGLIFGVLPSKCSQWQAEAAREAAEAAAKTTAPAPGNVSKAAPQGTNAQSQAARASSGMYKSELDKIAELPAEEQPEPMATLMAAWVAEDLAAATAYVASLPAGEFRKNLSAAFMEAWGEKDAASAAAWLSPRLGSGQWQEALGALCSVWAGKEAAVAAMWAQGLSNETDANTAINAIAAAWGESSPKDAAAWLTQLPESAQPGAATQILDSWATVKPEEAAAWLASTLPTNPNLPASLGGSLVDTWVVKDAGGASRWINSLPDGPLYDTAATVFAQSAASINPKDALPWAKTLTNEETRRHAVVHVLEEWYGQNAPAFYEALPSELDTMDAATRRAVYEMLYQKDPKFKDNMLNLTEE